MNLRYPAIPLVSVDPFLNIWSCSDKLCDDTTRHWTGRRHSLIGLMELDGKPYRFMGKLYADNRYSREPEVLSQTDVKVYPMRTVYTFENEIIRLSLTFMTPLLTDDLKLMTRPVSYISYKIESLDKKAHKVKLLFGADAEISVNIPTQEVMADTYENGVFAGRGKQDVLCGSGDDRNIEWGYLHLFARNGYTPKVRGALELGKDFSKIFLHDAMPKVDAGKSFSPAGKLSYISLEKEFELDTIEEDFICIAYDDIHSIMYFGKMIDAYYKKDGDTFSDVCKKAISEYDEICSRVENFEKELLKKASAISEKYADIISLSYRQVIAAHKLTWDGEEIQFLSKECFSNGCIGTLDVTYPSIPMFLMLRPELVEGMLNPLFKYAASNAWEYDFAPHDVGRYPIANGQVYGIDENGNQQLKYQMPVEESGNAILTVYALCHYKKDFSYFKTHKDILTDWVKYLIKYGLDPENQLCTDDFAGHLAHNCNLSVKAIMGICAFGKLLENIGEDGSEYTKLAKEYALSWEETAKTGNHFKLAFDKEDSWSLKYNIIWDKIFGWGIFSDEVFEKEISYYKTKINEFGLPLDSRSDYTKSDWQMWTVRMTDDKAYANMIIDAMWNMLDKTPDRVPFSDWYYTSDAVQAGFQNRTVQGGLFVLMI